MGLLALALVRGRAEPAGSLSALSLGSLLIAAGPIAYAISTWVRARARQVAARADLN
jgi:hypothetical protein